MAERTARYKAVMNYTTHKFFAILGGFLLALLATGEAQAQNSEPPYWKSLRYERTFMRVGPSGEYPIDWVYRRQGLPVRVLRTREGWDFVEEPDGTKGWISASQLTRARSAIVTGEEPVSLREEPQADSKMLWRAAPGVVAKLLSCREDWCEINIEGRAGWVEADRLWGDEDPGAAQ
ncbi:MAG: SH3 domain-containing protein [Pseudomonadota bacterium]